MGKNTNSDNNTSLSDGDESSGVCQKLFTAFKVSPAFQTIRRISHRPRDPTPRATDVVGNDRDHRRTVEIKPKSSDKAANHVRAVPIKFVHTNGTGTKNSDSATNVAVEKVFSVQNDVVPLPDRMKPEADIPSQRKKNPEALMVSTDHQINATFKEYIQRAGIKIRTVPAESDGGDHSQKKPMCSADPVIKKKDGFRDHFSDYIQSTKVKITSPARSAPNNTTGKSVSLKTDK